MYHFVVVNVHIVINGQRFNVSMVRTIGHIAILRSAVGAAKKAFEHEIREKFVHGEKVSSVIQRRYNGTVHHGDVDRVRVFVETVTLLLLRW